MDPAEESPPRRLRQFRCVYPGCPSSRTNKRNNIERHVWTQHLRIKLKMPEVRYFARTFKHYVDPYVQEVKDGRVRQRGRRAKYNPATSGAERPKASSVRDSTHGNGERQGDGSGSDGSASDGDSLDTETDGSLYEEGSAHASQALANRERLSEPQHAGYDTPGSLSNGSYSHPGSRRGSVPENRFLHYQFHQYQYKDNQQRQSAARARAQTQSKPQQRLPVASEPVYRTTSAPAIFTSDESESTGNSRSSSKLSQHDAGTPRAATITMYGQRMPLPPVGSSLVPISLPDTQPLRDEAPMSPVANIAAHRALTDPREPRPHARLHDHSPMTGPLAPLLLALQTIDAAECVAAGAAPPASDGSPATGPAGTRPTVRFSGYDTKLQADSDSMWRPWERIGQAGGSVAHP